MLAGPASRLPWATRRLRMGPMWLPVRRGRGRSSAHPGIGRSGGERVQRANKRLSRLAPCMGSPRGSCRVGSLQLLLPAAARCARRRGRTSAAVHRPPRLAARHRSQCPRCLRLRSHGAHQPCERLEARGSPVLSPMGLSHRHRSRMLLLAAAVCAPAGRAVGCTRGTWTARSTAPTIPAERAGTRSERARLCGFEVRHVGALPPIARCT
jgi:hypothetical protein